MLEDEIEEEVEKKMSRWKKIILRFVRKIRDKGDSTKKGRRGECALEKKISVGREEKGGIAKEREREMSEEEGGNGIAER